MEEDIEENDNAEKTEHERLLEMFEVIRKNYLRNVEFVEREAYDFFPCWIIGTYIFKEFESYPYVYLHAPKRSGKTKTLTLTSRLARNSLFAVNISQASIYRVIEEREPTLFIDEADYLSREEKAEMGKILNSGYKKGAVVVRCEPKKNDFEIREWEVYCPKMVASVRELKDQFIDRCITIPLLRSRNKEIANSIIKENVDDEGIKWEVWRTAIGRYAEKNKKAILENFDKIDSDDRMEEIIGRDRELWLPILAIGKTLSQEIYVNLINLALGKVARTREQEKETLENALIEELLIMVKEDSWIMSRDIHSNMKLKPEWEWLNPRTTGKVLKRLNFRFKHSSKGNMYLVKMSELKELARRYGVEDNEQSE